jgi:hypothetical protein
MAITAQSATVKVVGTNGQISLGKQYAGRQILMCGFVGHLRPVFHIHIPKGIIQSI